MTSSNHTALQLDHVCFQYGTQTVLDDVCLTVNESEFLGLIGPNGGGKTTLLRLMLGIESPERGSVRILGERPDRQHRWRSRTGVVPQFTSVNDRFPVRAGDVVEMGTHVRGGPRRSESERREMIAESLELVGASSFAEKPMWSLSGGERQRILVARALVNQPELLLLDEPTVGVDAHGQDLIYKWVTKWREQRPLTVVMISHDVGVVAPLCDRLACLNVKLHFHDRSDKLTGADIEKAYGCPAEVVFHSKHMPHRVVKEHGA